MKFIVLLSLFASFSALALNPATETIKCAASDSHKEFIALKRTSDPLTGAGEAIYKGENKKYKFEAYATVADETANYKITVKKTGMRIISGGDSALQRYISGNTPTPCPGNPPGTSLGDLVVCADDSENSVKPHFSLYNDPNSFANNFVTMGCWISVKR